MIELFAHLFLFWFVTALVGLPLVARLPLEPIEKLTVSAAASLVTIYLFAGTVYLLKADIRFFWLLPMLALSNAITFRDLLRGWFSDPEFRAALVSSLLLCMWSLGWMGLIVSYSGGGWAGDWFEHYDRMNFFLEHWPAETKLVGIYALPARPPLANLVTGGFHAMTGGGFATFQLLTSLLSSLVFWPLLLCVRRWGRLNVSTASCALGLVLALNPLFLQNSTFSWTKLPAAFLILTGLYCFAEGFRRQVRALRLVGAATLGAAAITHYSTGPYLIGLVGFYWGVHRNAIFTRLFWRESVSLLLVFCALPATWFSWSMVKYGTATTFASNTAVGGNPALTVSWWEKAAWNIYNTIVPHPLASEANGFMAQSSVWGSWRDFFFNLYQVNLPLAFGCVGFGLVSYRLVCLWREGKPGIRGPAGLAIGTTVVFGIVSNGDLDPHGSTHLSLQSLVLAGLALMAAAWPTLSTRWRLMLALGWTFDGVFGIALHFANQGFLIDDWISPNGSIVQFVSTFSVVGQMNFNAKVFMNAVFVGEHYRLPPLLILPLLAASLALMVIRARKSSESTRP